MNERFTVRDYAWMTVYVIGGVVLYFFLHSFLGSTFGGHHGSMTKYGLSFVMEEAVEDGPVVELVLPTQFIEVNTPTILGFNVISRPDNTPLRDIEKNHEQYMHVIGVRSDLSEFFHVHPSQKDNGMWEAVQTFILPGAYHLWSEIKKGSVYVFGHGPISVSSQLAGGVGEENSSTGLLLDLNSVEFKNKVLVGGLEVSLNGPSTIRAGKSALFNVVVRSEQGEAVVLGEYLGSKMHLIAIHSDLSEFIHAHPEAHDTDMHEHGHAISGLEYARAHGGILHGTYGGEHMTFGIVFPKEGVYKLFAQFRPDDSSLPPLDTLVAEFFVDVK